MGCFNVACSVSNISIGHGDNAVFIPLLPKNWILKDHPSYKDHKVGTQSMLLYSDCYFTAFCLPIKGKYDDYGSLEYIEQNENTEAIEKFFGCSIEDFMKTVTRGGFDGYTDGAAFNLSHINNLRSYDPIKKKDMTDLGFTLDNGFYTHPKIKHKVSINATQVTKNSSHLRPSWSIVAEDGSVVAQERHSGYLYKLIEKIAEVTNYYPGIPDDFQEKARILDSLSGMFIQRDIYDTLSKKGYKKYGKPNIETLEKIGFIEEFGRTQYGKPVKAYYHPEVEDQDAYVLPDKWCFTVHDSDEPHGMYDIDSLEKLALHYVEKHGVILDTSKVDNKCTQEENFKQLIKVYKTHLKDADKIRNADWSKLPPELKIFDVIQGPFHNGSLDSRKYFRNMIYAEGLYSEFLNNKLLPDYSEWEAAKNAMFSSNVFFFPAMNGEQHGNDEQSLEILEKSLEVVKAKIAERNEY